MLVFSTRDPRAEPARGQLLWPLQTTRLLATQRRRSREPRPVPSGPAPLLLGLLAPRTRQGMKFCAEDVPSGRCSLLFSYLKMFERQEAIKVLDPDRR